MLLLKSSRVLRSAQVSPNLKNGFPRRCLSGVKIQVEPQVSLVDEKLNTVVTGLRPHHEVSLRLSVSNNANLNYASVTHYKASDAGILDLSKSSPINGYPGDYPDPMSIFWTMSPQEKSDQRFWSINVQEGLHCNFQIFEGHLSSDQLSSSKPIASEDKVKREYMAPGVQRIPVKHGRVRGTLFIPPGPGPFPSIIKLYGGIHRGQVIEDKAALFASRGFVSLSLAFYGIEGLPQSYATQPLDLDYAEEAVDFILGQKEVDSSKGVGVCGISKGGELAYLMGTYLDEKVTSVAALNCPVHWSMVPVSYKGKIVLPAYEVPMDEDSIKLVGPNLYLMYNLFRGYRDQEAAIIPFAKTKTRILIIAGEDDKCCNSIEQADYAEEQMRKSGKTNYQILKYPGLGHLIDLPFAPPTTVTNHALFPKPNKLVMGGDNLQLHAHAQDKVWSQLITFFGQ